jgi:hypothetical protein
MTSIAVFTCPGAQQLVMPDGAPACADGAGVWNQVELAEPFDPSSLDSAQLGQAAAAGFTVLGVGLVSIAACRAVLNGARQRP